MILHRAAPDEKIPGVSSTKPINRTFGTAVPKVVETLAASCTQGTCPTVYRTDRGTLIVQGYDVEPDSAGVSIPAGERLVEIPIDLLRSAVEHIG
jgi:hypothetical protein